MNSKSMNEMIREASGKSVTVVVKPKDPVGDALRQAAGRGVAVTEQSTEQTAPKAAKGNAGVGAGAPAPVRVPSAMKMNRWIRRAKMVRTIVEREETL